MPRRLIALALAVLVLEVVARADAPSDYDKRVAAALYAAKDGTFRDHTTLGDDAFKGLRRWEKDAAKKTAQYILEIGGVKDGMDLRGLLRVGIGEPLPPAGAGWTAPATKPPEIGEAEVWIKKVETAADKFNDVAVRKGFGNVTLLARQRRPLHEPIDASVKAVCIFYGNLLKTAEHYKLFVGKMRLVYVSDPAQPDLSEVPLPCLISDQFETTYVIRAEVIDNEGNRMTNLKKMSFMLKGRLAGLATVTAGGQPVANPTAKFEVDDPPGATELVITLPKLDVSARAKLFQDYAAAKQAGEAPLWFKFSATFK